ncbi:MAG TPA: hypothetical protein VFG90_04530, partial [Nitrososphaeraceae archaeon]|nr:hypothetical protein [Nitrososphaeraceae archaeon]
LRHGLIGTPEKVAERVKEYADMGINQFLLAIHEPYDLRALELLTPLKEFEGFKRSCPLFPVTKKNNKQIL